MILSSVVVVVLNESWEETGRVVQLSFDKNVHFRRVRERLTLQLSFFLPVLLEWVAGGPPADGLEGSNVNQINNRAVRQSCLGARHRLGD